VCRGRFQDSGEALQHGDQLEQSLAGVGTGLGLALKPAPHGARVGIHDACDVGAVQLHLGAAVLELSGQVRQTSCLCQSFGV
jgi:hypothetical protein